MPGPPKTPTHLRLVRGNRGKDTPPFSVTDFTLHFTKTPTTTGPVTLDEAMRTWS